MTRAAPIRALDLVITSRCNLRCAYCFQGERRGGSMSWEVAKAATDLALRSSAPSVSIVFFGGEPTMSFDIVRRVLGYAPKPPASPLLEFSLVTNGTLLGPEEVRVLAEHGVATQISFDGVREAQERRAPGTFDVLNALLDRIRGEHPAFFAHKVSVSTTVSPRSIPQLARSVAYLMEKGVQRIVVAPDLDAEAAWSEPMRKALDRAFEDILRLAVAHYRRTGTVPVALFRKRPESPPVVGVERPSCGAVSDGHLAVDVDGTLACCGVFAPSLAPRRSNALAACCHGLSGGNVGAPDVSEALNALHERVRANALFEQARDKRPVSRRCAGCHHRGNCLICPCAITLIPGNDDPDRLPSFPCAFHRVRMKYRARFPAVRPVSRGARRRHRAKLRKELAAFAENEDATTVGRA